MTDNVVPFPGQAKRVNAAADQPGVSEADLVWEDSHRPVHFASDLLPGNGHRPWTDLISEKRARD